MEGRGRKGPKRRRKGGKEGKERGKGREVEEGEGST